MILSTNQRITIVLIWDWIKRNWLLIPASILFVGIFAYFAMDVPLTRTIHKGHVLWWTLDQRRITWAEPQAIVLVQLDNSRTVSAFASSGWAPQPRGAEVRVEEQHRAFGRVIYYIR
ncbi:MAG: hypothetical protein U1E67_14790 [Hyphomicrobiales bacterium]